MLKPFQESKSDQRIVKWKRGYFQYKTKQVIKCIHSSAGRRKDFNDHSGISSKIFFNVISCQENV